MKKIVLTLTAAALLLFAPMTVIAQKIAHVDTQSILESLPEIGKINGELEAKNQQFDQEITKMQDEFQRKANEYDKNKATLSPAAQKEEENRLQEMYQRISQTRAQLQQEIQKFQSEKYQVIYDKVKTAIENVGKAGHYTYIFEKNAPLYIGTDAKDITNEVQAELKKLK